MTTPPNFTAWMALAYPWVLPDSPIWREQQPAWEAGFAAGRAAALDGALAGERCPPATHVADDADGRSAGGKSGCVDREDDGA